MGPIRAGELTAGNPRGGQAGRPWRTRGRVIFFSSSDVGVGNRWRSRHQHSSATERTETLIHRGSLTSSTHGTLAVNSS